MRNVSTPLGRRRSGEGVRQRWHESVAALRVRLQQPDVEAEQRRGRRAGRPAPTPPQYGPFSWPRWHRRSAVESLASLLFVNLFWVGLWDLLSNTVLPATGGDTSLQYSACIAVGALLLYTTNSLYDQPAEPGKSLAPGEQTPLLRSEGDEVVDAPCVPPRLEPRRLGERLVANVAAVLVWTGLWSKIDTNVLPRACSAASCKACPSYGEFPCAWWKIGFVLVGLVGMFFTRSLYSDGEVAYAKRRRLCCDGCGWRAPG